MNTSILIDFYRKQLKEKSTFYKLTKAYNLFAVSIITEYEIILDTQVFDALPTTVSMNGRHCEARSNLPMAAVLRLLQLAQVLLRNDEMPTFDSVKNCHSKPFVFVKNWPLRMTSLIKLLLIVIQ